MNERNIMEENRCARVEYLLMLLFSRRVIEYYTSFTFSRRDFYRTSI